MYHRILHKEKNLLGAWYPNLWHHPTNIQHPQCQYSISPNLLGRRETWVPHAHPHQWRIQHLCRSSGRSPNESRRNTTNTKQSLWASTKRRRLYTLSHEKIPNIQDIQRNGHSIVKPPHKCSGRKFPVKCEKIQQLYTLYGKASPKKLAKVDKKWK